MSHPPHDEFATGQARPPSRDLDNIARSAALFPTDGPLARHDLIGRDEEITALVADVQQGNHRILVGPDNAGKTSVARAVAGILEADGWDVAAVDLFRVSGPDSLTAALLASAGRESPSDDGAASLADVIRRLDADAESRGRRLLLCVDSFHELATTHIFGKIAEVGQQLRDALDATEHSVCLFVGGASTVLRDLFGSKNQPFHRFGRLTTLPPIAEQAWRDELPTRFAHGGCLLESAGLDRLLELNEGHARSTMLLAKHTFALAVATGATSASVDTVELGLQSALSAERPLADSRIAQVRALSKHALTTALRVATGESPYKNLPPAMARQTLRGLENAGVVDHPRAGTYTIADPMLRHHLLVVARGTGESPVTPALDEFWTTRLLLGAVASAPGPASVTAGPGGAGSTVDLPPAAAEPVESGTAAATPEIGPVEPHVVDAEPAALIADALPGAAEPQPVPVAAEAQPDAAEPPPVPVAAEAQPVADAGLVTDAPSDVPAPPPAIGDDDVRVEARELHHRVSSRARRRRDDPTTALRHPDRDEAAVVEDWVVRAIVSQAPERASAGGQSTPSSANRATAARVGRFISESVANDPSRYWQVEIGDRPVGGVVLYRPGSIVTTRPPMRIDPIAQAALLAVTLVLSIAGLVLLMVHQAWDWGAYVGLLFAAFGAAIVQIVTLAPRVLARARASWVARRAGGQVFEAVWSEPEAMAAVFRALARSLPGTRISGYAGARERVAAFRELGFCVHRNRVVDGVLDPDAAQPIRPIDTVTGDRVNDDLVRGSRVVTTRVDGKRTSPGGNRRRPHPSGRDAEASTVAAARNDVAVTTDTSTGGSRSPRSVNRRKRRLAAKHRRRRR